MRHCDFGPAIYDPCKLCFCKRWLAIGPVHRRGHAAASVSGRVAKHGAGFSLRPTLAAESWIGRVSRVGSWSGRHHRIAPQQRRPIKRPLPVAACTAGPLQDGAGRPPLPDARCAPRARRQPRDLSSSGCCQKPRSHGSEPVWLAPAFLVQCTDECNPSPPTGGTLGPPRRWRGLRVKGIAASARSRFGGVAGRAQIAFEPKSLACLPLGLDAVSHLPAQLPLISRGAWHLAAMSISSLLRGKVALVTGKGLLDCGRHPLLPLLSACYRHRGGQLGIAR